ncbi:MAG TPA: ABC transporter permease [Vicinamibacterales bacterium]|nr:ABC transporter permease [Vicinamibacterales bacterium]
MELGTIRIAVRALARHKLRTFLTMLGMIIGVAAVMTMVALGSGAQASVEDEMKSAGTNLVYVSAGNYTRGGDDVRVASGLGSSKTLVQADVDAIRSEVTGIKFISPGVGDRAPMAAGAVRYFNRVVGVGAEFSAMHSWTLRRGGTMFGSTDVAQRAKVAVIGTSAATAMFGATDPVGQTFSIRNQPFRVVAVTESKIEDQPDSVFVPYSTLQQMRGLTSLETITVAAEQAGDTSRIATDIGAMLRKRHQLASGAPDDFTVKTEAAKALTKGLYTSAAVFVLANLPQLDQITLEEMTGTLQQTSNTLTMLLASIAAISLVVGGIGIMNIMLVSVTERTREIGLRMALGARGRDVLVQFLVEALTLSVAGGAVGVALGFVSSRIVTRMLEWQTVITPGAVAMAFGTALATGVFFGFYPARRASQLDPIDALRFE